MTNYKQKVRRFRQQLKSTRRSVEKLQNENDRLRLELLLYQTRIQNTQQPVLPHPISYSECLDLPPRFANHSVNTIAEVRNSPLASTSLSSHYSPSNMDELEDESDDSSSDCSQTSACPSSGIVRYSTTTNTLLSYAAIPNWDYYAVLAIPPTNLTKQKNELPWTCSLQMKTILSIVIDSIITLNAEKVLANNQFILDQALSTLSKDRNISSVQPILHDPNVMTEGLEGKPGGKNDRIGSNAHSIETTTRDVTEERMNIKYQKANVHQRVHEVQRFNHIKKQRHNRHSQQLEVVCPIQWLHSNICRFMATYMISRLPKLKNPCKKYLLDKEHVQHIAPTV